MHFNMLLTEIGKLFIKELQKLSTLDRTQSFKAWDIKVLSQKNEKSLKQNYFPAILRKCVGYKLDQLWGGWAFVHLFCLKPYHPLHWSGQLVRGIYYNQIVGAPNLWGGPNILVVKGGKFKNCHSVPHYEWKSFFFFKSCPRVSKLWI